MLLVSDALALCAMNDVPGFVVDLVAESRGVDDGQRDAGALLVKLEF